MKERDFAKNIVTPWLKENDIFFFKPRGGPYSENGVADYIVSISGIFVALELKVGKNKPTPLQGRWGRKVVAAGGIYLVCWPENWDVIQKTLLSIKLDPRVHFYHDH